MAEKAKKARRVALRAFYLNIHAIGLNDCLQSPKSPLVVTLKYFKAQWVHGKNVNLAWAMAVEFDNYGFEVYRSAVNDNKTVEIVGFVAPDPARARAACTAWWIAARHPMGSPTTGCWMVRTPVS